MTLVSVSKTLNHKLLPLTQVYNPVRAKTVECLSNPIATMSGLRSYALQGVDSLENDLSMPDEQG